MTVSELLFSIIVPITLKDEVVDRLMGLAQLSGFNLKTIYGYSKAHSDFNITEQVEGYREMVQFDILLAEQDKQALIDTLKPVCQPARLKYWFTPIIESGHF